MLNIEAFLLILISYLLLCCYSGRDHENGFKFQSRVAFLQYFPDQPIPNLQDDLPTDITLAHLSFSNVFSYCKYHGYDYYLIDANLTYVIDVLQLYPSWIKMFAIYHYLRHTTYDYIVYIDPTIHIHDFKKPILSQLEQWNPFAYLYFARSSIALNLHLSEDSPTHKAGEVFLPHTIDTAFQVWKKDPDTLDILEKWISTLKLFSDGSSWSNIAPFEIGSYHLYIAATLEVLSLDVHEIFVSASEDPRGVTDFVILRPWQEFVDSFSDLTNQLTKQIIFQSLQTGYLHIEQDLLLPQLSKYTFKMKEEHYDVYHKQPQNFIQFDYAKIHPTFQASSSQYSFPLSYYWYTPINANSLDSLCSEYHFTDDVCKDLLTYVKTEQSERNEKILRFSQLEAMKTFEFFFHNSNCQFKAKSILDVGANRGSWTNLMKELYFPNAHYFFVEGNDELIDYYIKNNVNHSYEITLVGNYTGKIIFYRNGNEELSGGNSIFKETHEIFSHMFQPIEANITTIDELVARRKIPLPIDIIKFDIQGGEYDALLGAQETLKTVEIIQAECALLNYNEGSPTFLQVNLLLESLGFHLFQISELNGDAYNNFVQFDAFWVKNTSQIWHSTCSGSLSRVEYSHRMQDWLSSFLISV